MRGGLSVLLVIFWAAVGARSLVHGGVRTPAPRIAPGQASASSDESTVWAGVYSEAQAGRGQNLYTNECSSCHGQALEGADEAPALTGLTFTANWDGLSVGDLFERIRISMPQDQPGKLSREQYADVVAFLLQANKFPAGKSDLPTELPKLKQILIKVKQP